MVESLRCQLPFSLAGVRDQFNGPLRPALLRFRVLTDFRLQLLSSPEPFDRYFEGEADGVRCESQGVIWDPMNLPFGGSKQPHIFLSTLRRLLFGRSTTQYDLCSPPPVEKRVSRGETQWNPFGCECNSDLLVLPLASIALPLCSYIQSS